MVYGLFLVIYEVYLQIWYRYLTPCQMPLSWDRLEDRVLVGPEAIQEMEE